MRNLKKFLALVMAMAMAFSLMVTANATSTGTQYSDNDKVTPAFEEAVDVLTGMGVFSGDNGEFKPERNVTRAEVAALIYRLATGDVKDEQEGLYAEYGNFSDVRKDAWYAGYVGYCANAGYIKGRPGNVFDPTGNVTGYEALAMILRVIGYDKNGEFTGPTWQVEVSALSQQLHILDNIKTTDYGNTLYLASRRDVVAELLFEADAYVKMVNYTPAFGYQPYGDVHGTTGSLTGGTVNNTLGWKVFGLTFKSGGVVIGNQETGETATKLGYSGTVDKAYDAATRAEITIQPVRFNRFTYEQSLTFSDLKNEDGTDVGAAKKVRIGDNWTFNYKSTVDVIGHDTKVWFDYRPGGKGGASGFKTYAYFDNSTLDEVVKVGKGTSTLTDAELVSLQAKADPTEKAAGGVTLRDAMASAGFSVGDDTTAVLNNSFGKFSLQNKGGFDSALMDVATVPVMNGTRAGTEVDWTEALSDGTVIHDAETSPEYLYKVISNNPSKSPEAVIALNLQTGTVNGVDNINAIKTVTVPYVLPDETPITDGNDGWPFISHSNVLTNTQNERSVAYRGGAVYVAGGTLEQDQLVGNSVKGRDDKEVGLHITGTQPYTPERSATYHPGTAGNGDNYDINWFKLNPITQIKDGIVASFNDKTVTLQDGTVLEKSILFDTVVPGTIPQIAGTNADPYDFTGYRFFLTDGNKFVGAQRQYGTTFLYGTYFDYSTETSSSAFKYYMTGVTLDGQMTTVPVKTLNGINDGLIFNETNLTGIPFRDTIGGGSQAMNGIGAGIYRGFALGGENVDWTFEELDNIGVVSGANGSSTTTTPADIVVDDNAPGEKGPATDTSEPSVVFDGDATTVGVPDSITVGSTQQTLGAAYAGTIYPNGTAGGANSDDLYFTNDTTFILVSGYGTDSLDTKIYKGLGELRRDATAYINLHYEVDNVTQNLPANSVRLPHILEDVKMSDMTYLTQEPFLYAQNQVLSRQAKVVILPAAAVTWSNSFDTYYVGNSAALQVNSNPDLGRVATQFAMYQDGEKKLIWVAGEIDGTAGNNTLSYAQTTPTAGASSADVIADTGHDHFYDLVDTGRKANDGQPIYAVSKLTNLTGTQNEFLASTYSAQTGSFISRTPVTGDPNKTTMLNVSDANITNLNTQYPVPVWPGILDGKGATSEALKSLCEAGSLGLYPNISGQYGGVQKLYVSIVYSGLTVQQLYVCYDQTPATT